MLSISHNSKEAGYSLVETLVAFAIMIMVLAVLIPGISSLPSRSKQLEEKILAADFAHSQLAKLGRSEPIMLGSFVQTLQNHWSWEQDISVHDLSIDDVTIVEVTITVSRVSNEDVLARISALKVLP